MNRDTYARFLRSEVYKELLLGGKKKVSKKFKYMIILAHMEYFFFFFFFFFVGCCYCYYFVFSYPKNTDKENRANALVINYFILI